MSPQAWGLATVAAGVAVLNVILARRTLHRRRGPIMPPKEPPPRTVAEAVDRLIARLPPATLDLIRGADRAYVVPAHHFGLGLWVRNNFGLWESDSELLRACGTTQADHGSSVILDALWDRLVTSATADELAASRQRFDAWTMR